jgi:uncharacterized membrane protein
VGAILQFEEAEGKSVSVLEKLEHCHQSAEATQYQLGAPGEQRGMVVLVLVLVLVLVVVVVVLVVLVLAAIVASFQAVQHH